ncbi:MAG: GGDEF domain-containing protein [Gemmatirosa sp.]|nr:GGDEF domain-containing protein [Gemmatirosa sp.]
MSPRRDWLSAEVIAWQARYRIVAALLGGGAGVVLRLLGVVRPPAPSSGDAPWIGVGGLWAVAALVAAYAGLAWATAWRASSLRSGGRRIRHVVPLADLALVYGLVILLASPAHYERALVLSIFAVLLAQLYFGTGPALVAFRVSVGAYAVLLVTADSAGARIDWADSLLSLGLYALGGGLVALVHESRQRRLSGLVRLFARLEEGDFTHAYDAARDPRPDAITAMGRAYDRMRTQLATIVLTDPLSGCLNRRGFEQQLAREVARSERAQGMLALLAVDLDRFKQINDEFGHLTGDAVLRETGALLRETARAGDVAARTGGEEFVVILPDTDMVGATAVAMRVVEAFRHHLFAGLPGRQVTVSVGIVAETVTDVNVAEDLKARADEALYDAKRTGRDRAVAWLAPSERRLMTAEQRAVRASGQR